MISLIVSEYNKVLPNDMDLLYKNKVKTYYMKFYYGHYLNDETKKILYKDLLKIKNDINKDDIVLYARSYGVFYKKCINEFKNFFDDKVLISTDTILRRLRELKAKNIFVITPYNQKRHELEIKWLNNNGFKTTGSIAMGKTGGDNIAKISHDMVIKANEIANNTDADTIYIACTILSTLPIIDKLKDKIPVVTASGSLIDIINEEKLKI